jgi:hypothetical protein
MYLIDIIYSIHIFKNSENSLSENPLRVFPFFTKRPCHPAVGDVVNWFNVV